MMSLKRRTQRSKFSLHRESRSSEFKHFRNEVIAGDMAQTRRIGMQNEKEKLPDAPRFSPYLYGPHGRVEDVLS